MSDQQVASITPESTPTPTPAPTPTASISTSIPGAISILKTAWAIYKKDSPILIGVMIIPSALMFALALILSVFDSPMQDMPVGIFISVIVVSLVLSVLAILFAVWGNVALLYTINQSQERIGVIEAYKRSLKKVISYWWIALLMAFIVLGGLFLFLIPGIIFSVWFSFAVFVLMDEDARGMNALIKSREYVRGNWFKVFWRFLFVSVIGMIASILIGVLVTLLQVPFAEEAGNLLVGIFITPFMMLYSFLVYKFVKDARGEVISTSFKKQKITFISIGIFGLLIIPLLLIIGLWYALNNMSEVREANQEMQDISDLETVEQVDEDITEEGILPEADIIEVETE